MTTYCWLRISHNATIWHSCHRDFWFVWIWSDSDIHMYEWLSKLMAKSKPTNRSIKKLFTFELLILFFHFHYHLRLETKSFIVLTRAQRSTDDVAIIKPNAKCRRTLFGSRLYSVGPRLSVILSPAFIINYVSYLTLWLHVFWHGSHLDKNSDIRIRALFCF